MKTLLCTLVLATLGTAVAQADTFTITFDQPNQTIVAGQTIEVFGTITNNSSDTIYLNSDDITLNGASFTLNDQFSNTPFFLTPSGQLGSSSGDIELFDITASSPLVDSLGKYTGTYDLVGGNDGGNFTAQDLLGTSNFSVSTEAAVAPVPEPSSIYLMLGGLSTALFPLAKKLRARA
jgi:hypothetical protein